MMSGHQRDVRVRMTYRRKNCVARSRMTAHLFRFLGSETLRRIDHVEIDDQFPNVVQIAGDGDAFDRVVAPTHFPGDDFAVLAHPHRMSLGVTILDINRRGKGMDCLFVNCAQAVVQASILFRLALYFLEQTVTVNANADVASQSAHDFQIFFGKFFSGSFLTEPDYTY